MERLSRCHTKAEIGRHGDGGSDHLLKRGACREGRGDRNELRTWKDHSKHAPGKEEFLVAAPIPKTASSKSNARLLRFPQRPSPGSSRCWRHGERDISVCFRPFFLQDFTQLGVSDPFGRVYWCKKSNYREAQKHYRNLPEATRGI